MHSYEPFFFFIPQLVEFCRQHNFNSIRSKLLSDLSKAGRKVEVGGETTPIVQGAKKTEIVDEEFRRLCPSGVTLVRDVETAKRVVDQLLKLTNIIHACDTEAIDLDLSKSVVGQGKV